MGLDISFYKKRKSNGENHPYEFKTIGLKNKEVVEIFNAKIEAENYDEAVEMYEELMEKENIGYNPRNHWIEPQEDYYDKREEIGYFRKVNFLMGIFDPYQTNDFVEVEHITKDLEDIKSKIETIFSEMGIDLNCDLKDVEVDEDKLSEVGADYLPTQGGFFFGSTDYNKYYLSDLKEVYSWIEKVLPDINEVEYNYEFNGDY